MLEKFFKKIREGIKDRYYINKYFSNQRFADKVYAQKTEERIYPLGFFLWHNWWKELNQWIRDVEKYDSKIIRDKVSKIKSREYQSCYSTIVELCIFSYYLQNYWKDNILLEPKTNWLKNCDLFIKIDNTFIEIMTISASDEDRKDKNDIKHFDTHDGVNLSKRILSKIHKKLGKKQLPKEWKRLLAIWIIDSIRIYHESDFRKKLQQTEKLDWIIVFEPLDCSKNFDFDKAKILYKINM